MKEVKKEKNKEVRGEQMKSGRLLERKHQMKYGKGKIIEEDRMKERREIEKGRRSDCSLT